MVYCGKASQGCQSCRERRIKCDKIRPQCTQCIRVAKACPGYRDQLELMFRDESTKVIQKAHAQWGVGGASETGGKSSGSSPTSTTSPSTPSSLSSRSRASISRASMRSKSLTPAADDSSSWVRAPKEVYTTRSDQAVRFFIEHYLVGHPDEPKASQELQGVGWIHAPQIQNIMAAVGLASMSNLTGDKGLQIMAREKYGLALRQMVSSIQNLETLDLNVSMRTIIILSLFEVIRGEGDTSNTRTHLMGAAALLRTILPRSGMASAPSEILRALLQLCFSMLIPCLVAENHLPAIFFDWVTMCENFASAPDKSSTDLIRIIARLVHLSAFMSRHVLADGHPKATEVIMEALDIDAQLDTWENSQEGIWVVAEECDKDGLPPDAVFEGCYHVYTDMWTARVWNHYRWSRTLVNQMLFRFAESFPISSKPLFTAEHQARTRNCIIRVARDLLVSIPTHYRHPRLGPGHRKVLEKTSGGAGMGAAGIPTLIFQIRAAACAPFLPAPYRSWAKSILETIWAHTGMTQAKAQAELVEKAQEGSSPKVTQLAIEIKQETEESKPTVTQVAIDIKQESKPTISGSLTSPQYPSQRPGELGEQGNSHTYMGVELPGR